MRHALAFPSWVIPGDITENAYFLAGKKETGVREIGLCFFESTACLNYDGTALSQALCHLDFSWHVHLPLDLFKEPPEKAATIALKLMDKISFLNVTRAVIHPPAQLQDLKHFVHAWSQSRRNAKDLLLENTQKVPLATTLTLAEQTGCGVCLDFGHALAELHSKEESESKFRNSLIKAASCASIVHMNAPEKKELASEKHLPLTTLSPQEQILARHMLAALPPECIIMLELFSWHDIQASLPILHALL